ncbi:hypothetical protein MRB53_025045 [Persea americana]|uniref:Uncharacterized protein n=1 Tax=Persea americana TaxID=3435 RepID=A0ACC2LDZ1_PERAE|nr:hypothetical protein MRB53_025045 [Persea americana]
MSRLLQLHSTKERMDENHTAYRQIFVVGLHGHLMRDVGAGAVSSHHQGTAVVDGDDEDVDFCSEGVKVRVVGGEAGALEAEVAAMEVDKHGEFLGWGKWFGEVYDEQVYDATNNYMMQCLDL